MFFLQFLIIGFVSYVHELPHDDLFILHVLDKKRIIVYILNKTKIIIYISIIKMLKTRVIVIRRYYVM